jgi:hypothetical protein
MAQQAEWMQGVVKFFNPGAGFGFITADGEDYFFAKAVIDEEGLLARLEQDPDYGKRLPVWFKHGGEGRAPGQNRRAWHVRETKPKECTDARRMAKRSR